MQEKKKKAFELEFIKPYTSFVNGKPKAIPMVVQGLLPQGGFAVLGAAPKNSKSSLSRYLATSIVKGTEFLGRGTTQGDVVLASLEDPRQHADNCLHTLGYDDNSTNDARIHILEKLPSTIEETVELLGNDLTKRPNVRLVIIDTLAKALRVKDLNDYVLVMAAIEQVKDLARQFDKLNIFCLAHCKKVRTEDPFERLLGSTALRGEPDTNIVMFKEGDLRVIETEGRIVKNIPRSILQATLVECEGADVVTNFSIGQSMAQYEAEQDNKTTTKRAKKALLSVEDRFRAYLTTCPNLTSSREVAIEAVQGKKERKIEALAALEKNGELKVSGVKQSKTDPLILTLLPGKSLGGFMERFSSQEGAQ